MRRQVTQLMDDLDGHDITGRGSTIRFGLEGRSYEIDLSESNAASLREALAPFIRAARVTAGPARKSPAGRDGAEELARIRAWARANGHQVSERGRIAASVREAYDAAHS